VANDKTSTRDRAVTRADVARYAGVSTAVVSYVMNGGPRKVAPETAARVREAIAQLDYRPNVHAQALRRGTTEMIGLVLADPTNPFFLEFVAAITEAAYAYGRAVVIASARARPDTELTLVDDLVRRRVDGLIVASVFGRPDLSLGRSHRQTPMVFIDAPGTVPATPASVPTVSEAPISQSSIWGGFTTTRPSAWWWAAWTAPARTLASRVGNRPFALRGSKTGRSPEWTGTRRRL
jgi:Bacterial regulatory proteins, lacI family/Periplasmic binding proteins and sugar binding domain of LacI family